MARKIMLLLLISLSGCSGLATMDALVSVTGLGKETTALRKITITSADNANRIQATMVDLVFVLDETVAAQLPDNAVDWFKRRYQLQRQLASQLAVASAQIPPGQRLASLVLPDRSNGAVRVLAYANYLAPDGQGVMDVTDYKRLHLQLQKDQVAISEQPGWGLW